MEPENPKPQFKPVEVIHARDIVPTEVSWLWYPYIPFGKVTLIQGDPGDGKSKFMLALSALLTKGEPLPFTSEAREPINVIYQTTEDDADDTVVPRFIASGGDVNRLTFIKEKDRYLTFTDDRIKNAIIQENARLMILDPFSSYIGKETSINSANDVRTQFNPLIEAAKETGCAIVIVGHMNKMLGAKALYRTVGSIDVVGAVRSALLIARTDKERPDERVMCVQKSNLAPTGSGIIFTVSDHVEWVRETEATADEVLGLGICDPGRKDSQMQSAKDALETLLPVGSQPIPSTQVIDRVKALGIGESTIKKAKEDLHIESVKIGNVWYWKRKNKIKN